MLKVKVKKQKILLILLIALGLAGCLATNQSSWRKAEESNTITAYFAFLEKYPQSEFSAEAKSRIEQLARQLKQQRMKQTLEGIFSRRMISSSSLQR
ncbi:MAG: hypothetical protein GY797_18530 [Deltaproteobacteria bacterium]|nr:hypothetical protein [Deltaproteobacteria bacterium]